MRNTLVESQLRVSKFINYDDSAVKLIRRGRIAIKYNVQMAKQMANCRIFWVLTVKFDISQKLNFIFFKFSNSREQTSHFESRQIKRMCWIEVSRIEIEVESEKSRIKNRIDIKEDKHKEKKEI